MKRSVNMGFFFSSNLIIEIYVNDLVDKNWKGNEYSFLFTKPGGYSINYWVGMCRWDSETLSLH